MRMEARSWVKIGLVLMVAMCAGRVSWAGVAAGPAPVGPGVAVGPVATGPVAPPMRKDVALVSVSGRVDGGPQQLGPEFVVDLADNPQRLKLAVVVANCGSEPVMVYADLANRPWQLARARSPEPATLAAGERRTFEPEYQMRGLYETKMTEVPFAVGVVTGSDYVDEMLANNVVNCKLVLGRPDVVVTEVRIEPRILQPYEERARGQEPMYAVVNAFVGIENQGRGRLAADSARLDVSATWKPADILWGTEGEHPIRFQHDRALAGAILPPFSLPALEPGAAMTMWLQEYGPQHTKPNEGRVVMALTLTCTPRAGTVAYDEGNVLNNRKTFDVAYCVPDVFGYHPSRGTDYDNR